MTTLPPGVYLDHVLPSPLWLASSCPPTDGGISSFHFLSLDNHIHFIFLTLPMCVGNFQKYMSRPDSLLGSWLSCPVGSCLFTWKSLEHLKFKASNIEFLSCFPPTVLLFLFYINECIWDNFMVVSLPKTRPWWSILPLHFPAQYLQTSIPIMDQVRSDFNT